MNRPYRKFAPVIFVGAGPGDPELITLKGLRALQEADTVIFAGSLVNPELLDCLRPGVNVIDSASLTLEQVIDHILRSVRAGQQVVRLHTGDPALYGAIQEQMTLLDRAGVEYEVVPGVTAVFAAAASLGQQLTLPEVSQTLILTRAEGRTPVPENENLRKIAAIGGTICLYLSVGMIEEVVKILLAGGFFTHATPAAVVYRASWPDERILEGTLGDIAEKVAVSEIHRQALVLVGEVLASRHKGFTNRSKLYDPVFTHGYRK